jgi:hypothetical protein
MSLTGLVSLAESILNQTTAQDSQALATAAGAAGTGSLAAATANPGSSQDQFVPSAQTQTASATAEAAGLFKATQFSLFTAAAESLLAQRVPSPASTVNTPTGATNFVATVVPPLNATVATTEAGVTTTAPLDNAAAPATNTPAAGAAAARPTPAATNNASVAPVTAATPASATPQGALAVQQQLQTLNNSLAALGLSAADIQKVDQVAGLINDFSPTAFTSLVYQLEAVAQNVARQVAQAQNANSNAANT